MLLINDPLVKVRKIRNSYYLYKNNVAISESYDELILKDYYILGIKFGENYILNYNGEIIMANYNRISSMYKFYIVKDKVNNETLFIRTFVSYTDLSKNINYTRTEFFSFDIIEQFDNIFLNHTGVEFNYNIIKDNILYNFTCY
jgi:hypothetical protein